MQHAEKPTKISQKYQQTAKNVQKSPKPSKSCNISLKIWTNGKKGSKSRQTVKKDSNKSKNSKKTVDNFEKL